MNRIIEQVHAHSVNNPDEIAYELFDAGAAKEQMTWRKLDENSNALAAYLYERYPSNIPIVVYGHKSPYMLVCFLACVKSGHAYCPVDYSVPLTRVQDIINTVNPEVVLATVQLQLSHQNTLSLQNLKEICERYKGKRIREEVAVTGDDVYYIIFTSGSTGKPKGVQITASCLENFVSWGMKILQGGVEEEHPHFLNQAPFSFDLSVMDLYLSLYSGGTLCAFTKGIQGNQKELYEKLHAADISVWVSTPSFADVALSDRMFDSSLLPNIKQFLFCGEILTNRTVEKLLERFPKAQVVNTYGPTESTVAVTEIVINREVLKTYSPLPVGSPRHGTWIQIVDEAGNILSDGDRGEIVIIGDTVSIGYYKSPELTKKVFDTTTIGGDKYRLYHTGDKGYIKSGQLFYCGRLDFQVKLHGYRIEIEDIENNLTKISHIEKAAVLPNYRNEKVSSLTAYVVSSKYATDADSFALTQEIREELKKYIPEYMIPKKVVFLDMIPMTNNGKVDRKALEGLKI